MKTLLTKGEITTCESLPHEKVITDNLDKYGYITATTINAAVITANIERYDSN